MNFLWTYYICKGPRALPKQDATQNRKFFLLASEIQIKSSPKVCKHTVYAFIFVFYILPEPLCKSNIVCALCVCLCDPGKEWEVGLRSPSWSVYLWTIPRVSGNKPRLSDPRQLCRQVGDSNSLAGAELLRPWLWSLFFSSTWGCYACFCSRIQTRKHPKRNYPWVGNSLMPAIHVDINEINCDSCFSSRLVSDCVRDRNICHLTEGQHMLREKHV